MTVEHRTPCRGAPAPPHSIAYPSPSWKASRQNRDFGRYLPCHSSAIRSSSLPKRSKPWSYTFTNPLMTCRGLCDSPSQSVLTERTHYRSTARKGFLTPEVATEGV